MSVILDALKKLDHEKSSRRNGTADIAAEILRPDLPRPGKRIRLEVAVVFLTAIAAAAITFAVMGGGGFLSKSSSPGSEKTLSRSQQVTPVPFPSEPTRDAREEISGLPPKIQIPVERKKAGEMKTPAEAKTPVERKNSPTSRDEKKASQNVVSGETDVASGNIIKPAEQVPSVPVTTPPSLKLSGIVWYEEPSKRLAVINGMIATEGSMIEGVKVVEIYPTRVRLLHNGRSFEITLSQ